jgi:L-iditol 2-dehydrogenase
MNRYTAAVMPGPDQDIRLQEFPAPELEPGAALLHTVFSEVCGTDVHLHHGRLKGVPYPIIPGHVSVGRIAEARGPVTDIEGAPLHPGDLVTFLDVHETCNRCWYCLVAKETTRCPSRRVYGITYSADEGLLGGWSQAIWLKPGVKLIRLPDALPPEAFIGGGCGLVTSLHAVDLARIRLGEAVVVLGVGPVGQSAVALAARSGAGQVIAIGDPEDRQDFARRMGAAAVAGLELPPSDRAAQVRSWTHGRGADVVIEASGAPEAVPQALDLVRDGGRVVVVGQYTDHGSVAINPHLQINRKHVELRGCWGSDYSHFHRAVALAALWQDRIPWSDLATARYPLERAGEALRDVELRNVVKAVIQVEDSRRRSKMVEDG